MATTTTSTTSSSAPSASRPFRLNGKSLFLTYPQCDTPKETVLNNIKEKFGQNLVFAVVSREAHQDQQPHLHAVVSLAARVDYNSPNCLDSLANSHGNYQAARSLRKSVEYVVKDGDFTAHGVVVSDYLQAAKGKKSTKATVMAQKMMDGATLADLVTLDPGFVMMNLQKLRSFQLLVQTLKNAPTKIWMEITPPIFISPQLRKLAIWLNENLGKPRRLRQKQLLLSSPPGLGKTSLVEKLLEYFKVYPHVGGKWFDGYEDGVHQLIVMDEFVGGVPMTVMNKILDGQVCTIEVKGNSVWKTHKVPVMILTNKTDYNLYTGEKVDDVIRDAFFDRVTYIRLEPGDEPWRLFPFFNEGEALPAPTTLAASSSAPSDPDSLPFSEEDLDGLSEHELFERFGFD